MEQDLTALAAAAAATLVQMMTTDAWEQVKAAVTALWRRAHRQADMVEAELDAARLKMLAASEAGDEETELQLVEEWAARLRQLAADDTQRLADLLELTERFPPGSRSGEIAPAISVSMQAKASGRGRVFQAGRDQKITER